MEEKDTWNPSSKTLNIKFVDYRIREKHEMNSLKVTFEPGFFEELGYLETSKCSKWSRLSLIKDTYVQWKIPVIWSFKSQYKSYLSNEINKNYVVEKISSNILK